MARRPEDAASPNTPLLSPVLTLLRQVAKETVVGGGQGEKGVRKDRLARQRARLASEVAAIATEVDKLNSHSGRVLLKASMFDDSLAPTWTPRGLFDPNWGWRLISPYQGGYLVEVPVEKLRQIARQITTASSVEARTAISRVEQIAPFAPSDALSGRTIKQAWEAAEEEDGGRSFAVWLAPFGHAAARDSVVRAIESLEREGQIERRYPAIQFPGSSRSPTGTELVRLERPEQSSLARTARAYRQTGSARTIVKVESFSAFRRLVELTTSGRIDPVSRLSVTSPGGGPDPQPPVPAVSESLPVVAVIDGGRTAKTYEALEVWAAPPLLPTTSADTAHGNRITSLITHAHAWNTNLDLPELNCRFATVQAIPKDNARVRPQLDELVEYLREVAKRAPREARVWNLSFNCIEPEADFTLVSYLGHELGKIAREYSLLFVISTGNCHPQDQAKRLCAPADCEAGLTVGGRTHDKAGRPAGACSISRKGPGPDGMFKPDASWFSTVRGLGGTASTGSSFSTALVSSLAAHAFENLRDPSPDLVRALLLNSTEGENHDPALGWGSPWDGNLPWICSAGTVTLAWKAKLRPGYNYYWNDLPVPPQLLKAGKLSGKGRLTAVFAPLVSESGAANYFSTRLEVGVQYIGADGKVKNLLGSLKESIAPELEARAELAKWQPIRRHQRDFAKRGGLTYQSASKLRVRARVYARDLFQFGLASHHEVPEQDAAFVLTLSDGSGTSALYNAMVGQLGNFVESAVVEQAVTIET